MKIRGTASCMAMLLGLATIGFGSWCVGSDYPIVDTGQNRCYNNTHEIAYPRPSDAFYGQDAQYRGIEPSYRNNGDGTVTDLNTGLIWQKDPGAKKSLQQALAGAKHCRLGGYADWRLPSIKELYSLILFSGTDPDPGSSDSTGQRPFINTNYFTCRYGDPSTGERLIDAQFASSTKYVGATMNNATTVFGVNFADGRIKGYPIQRPEGSAKAFFVRYVRGNPNYGRNDFYDNGDGTITDRATGLIWTKLDSGHLRAGPNRDGKLTWEQALRWVEQLEYAGHADWRLPNIKELQSIVDYGRSPQTTNSPAAAPIFKLSTITREDGRRGYPFYWSSTTHAGRHRATAAAYVAFGEALGWMPSPRDRQLRLLDVHGAGAQRSDPKSGDPKAFPYGRGPQGDVIRILNFVRPVRGGNATQQTEGPAIEMPLARGLARQGNQAARSGEANRTDGRGRRGSSAVRRTEPERRPTQRTPRHMGNRGPAGRRTTGNPAARSGGFVSRLDRDGDGRVARTEFDGPPQHFDHLDRDGDGYLAEDEAPPPPGSRRSGASRGRRGGFHGPAPGTSRR